MLRGILIVVVLFLFSAPALAQPLSVSNGEDEEVMIFTEGEDLSGAPVRPFGEDLSSRSPRAGTSLITVRGDFVSELLSSVEKL